MFLFCLAKFSLYVLDIINVSQYVMFPFAAGHSDEIASWQHKQWATLGFIRGIAAPVRSGQAFCSVQWITLLFSVIESGLPSPGGHMKRIDSSTLLQQVLVVLKMKMFI